MTDSNQTEANAGALTEKSGWQTIDTCPTDEDTEFLVVAFGNNYKPNDTWTMAVVRNNNGYFEIVEGGGAGFGNDVTHWMRLPPPPIQD